MPAKHIIVFDIARAQEDYLSYPEKLAESARLGLETVPLLYSGVVSSLDELQKYLALESVLGGCKIEGVVVKNYTRFGADGKCLMGKLVSTEFKEMHGKLWRKDNPLAGDIIVQLVERYKTDARWLKAVYRMRDANTLTGSPADIGPLMREIQTDVLAECRGEIEEILFKWAWSKLSRQLCSGAAEWYKKRLLDEQFPTTDGLAGLGVQAAEQAVAPVGEQCQGDNLVAS